MNQWITIGWALEGAALLLLFHRVPHPGLRVVGVGLLIAAFARLAVNPYVLEYHLRAATPIFNWYLYAYGIVTVCLFTGAALLAAAAKSRARHNMRPILFTLGTVLAFLAVEHRNRRLLQRTGLCAHVPIQRKLRARHDLFHRVGDVRARPAHRRHLAENPGARYSAIGLLSVTVLKLFFHDLARLNQLYRIGALIGVAAIAFLASLALSAFLRRSHEKQ